MNKYNELIKDLRDAAVLADDEFPENVRVFNEAADTIETLLAELREIAHAPSYINEVNSDDIDCETCMERNGCDIDCELCMDGINE